MKTFITFIGIFFLTISCYSETLVKEELTSPPLQLREKGITKENIDHILIKFIKDNPDYHHLDFNPLMIKWVLEGLYNLQLISDRTRKDNKIQPGRYDAEIELYLKEPHMFIIPFVFNQIEREERFNYFSRWYKPDKKLNAVLSVCSNTLPFHVEMLPCSMAQYFGNMDCPELAIDILEKRLPFDKKSVRQISNSRVRILSEKSIEYMDPMTQIAEISSEYNLMIESLCKLKRYDEAIKWRKLHMDLFSDCKGMINLSVPYQKFVNITSIKKIADIYKMKGDLKNAKKYYEQAFSLNEDILKTIKEDDKNYEIWKHNIDDLKENIASCP